MDKHKILAGELTSDMGFMEKAWALTARVPAGKVVTYGQIAHKLGGRAYRAVGQAMHSNPLAPRVPCHRVVASDGSLNGFAGGLAKKQRMLQAEGVTITNGKVDLTRHQFEL